MGKNTYQELLDQMRKVKGKPPKETVKIEKIKPLVVVSEEKKIGRAPRWGQKK
ncbi:MAG: hypothetical protein WCX30_03595 [Candidatus Paceibacterota bacterium]